MGILDERILRKNYFRVFVENIRTELLKFVFATLMYHIGEKCRAF